MMHQTHFIKPKKRILHKERKKKSSKKRMNYLLVVWSIWMITLHGFAWTSQNNSSCSTNITFIQVGVILDLDSLVGRMGLSCLSMALSDFYSVHNNYTTKLVLHFKDSKGNVIDAADSALTLLKEVKVDAIVGPQKSAQANFLMDVGDRAHVPIISFSATSPSLSHQTSYFIQTAISDDAQVGAIAAIVQAFQWRQVVIISEDSDYGNGIVPRLANAFQDIDVRVSYRSVILLTATDDCIRAELYKMMANQTRVFVVQISHPLGGRLFPMAQAIGMISEGYAWIIASGLMDLLPSMDPQIMEAMQGVLGVRPRIPRSKRLDSFSRRWKMKFLRDNPSIKQAEVSMRGLWAYDTVWALAMAAEKSLGFGKKKTLESNNKTRTPTSPFSFGTSKTGPMLLKATMETRFEGLSGNFQLVNRKMNQLPFQILNVAGKGEREVGIWTPTLGIQKEITANNTNSCSAAREKFRTIIWPGDSIDAPKGWVYPVSGKTLSIGVPVKDGFSDLVKVEIDPETNVTHIDGQYIRLFDSVIKALPYAVPYELVAFAKPDGSSAGSYNDLVYDVFLQKYDAALGDFTITANRSKYVDFTLPFAEGGVAMIVPVSYEDVNGKWAFLKPLKSDLWLTGIAFFILTGIAVWILEHRINTAFRGPPSQQAGLILWFPFSTLVFAHREKLVSNLSRLVVTVWVFVVLILSSTYTASLSSTLTVQKLKPAITGVEELIKNGDYVGCQKGSFIVDLLSNKLGFEKPKVKFCNSFLECHEALSNGSKNGGISAFFDAMPYGKLFLTKYCNKYTIVGPVYKTDGFAYVFPKGSPLVADISRAIISITEGDKSSDSGLVRSCAGPDTTVRSTGVSLGSFEGLFAITGCVTGTCIVVFLLLYLYKNRDFLGRIMNSRTSTWSRISAICTHFDQKDLSAYPFSRSRQEGNQDQVQQVSDFGGECHIIDSPSLPRISTSSGEDSFSEVEMNNAAAQTIHPRISASSRVNSFSEVVNSAGQTIHPDLENNAGH